MDNEFDNIDIEKFKLLALIIRSDQISREEAKNILDNYEGFQDWYKQHYLPK